MYRMVTRQARQIREDKKVRKIWIPLLAMALVIGVGSASAKGNCTSIKDGILTYPANHYLAGQLLRPGFDPYGYNFQAHLFRGSFANIYLGAEGYPPYDSDDETYLAENPGAEQKWFWPYRDIDVTMKWNNAWLSNSDCDGDGLLERHYGFDSYIGSGAWLTNHYRAGKGKDHWTYFTKIVAVPEDAVEHNGIWYDDEDKEIGPVVWSDFATLMEVESGAGATYVSPSGPGFGRYKP